MTWKKICCAVDFSEPARAAMVSAAELARRFRSELSLVHVAAPLAAGVEVLATGEPALEDAERVLAQWSHDAANRAGAPVRHRVLTGDAADAIVAHAEEDGVALLVVGTHGLGGVKRLLLGSVAAEVVRRAACPVLVVRDHEATRRAEEDAEELAQYRAS